MVKGKKLIKDFSKEKKVIKIGVLGYPNVGKSSLINKLKRKKVATVSPKPGMTRGKQLIRLYPNVYLIDTPGIITLEYQEDLALKGSYLPEKLEEPVEAALKFLEKVINNNPEALEKAYNVKVKDKDPYTVLNSLAEKLNYRLSGGKLDLERTAKKILWDWIKGQLKIYWI